MLIGKAAARAEPTSVRVCFRSETSSRHPFCTLFRHPEAVCTTRSNTASYPYNRRTDLPHAEHSLMVTFVPKIAGGTAAAADANSGRCCTAAPRKKQSEAVPPAFFPLPVTRPIHHLHERQNPPCRPGVAPTRATRRSSNASSRSVHRPRRRRKCRVSPCFRPDSHRRAPEHCRSIAGRLCTSSRGDPARSVDPSA